MVDLVTQATEYAKNHNLHLFPVKPNKAPVTAHGFKEATTDLATLERWFDTTHSRGMGVHPGRSGYVVVDIDVKDGAEGEEQWSDIGVEFDGPEVLTPSGGRHLWYRKPEGLTFDNRSLDDSIDIRGDNGYVILPESFNYHWDLSKEADACQVCSFYHPVLEDAPVFPQVLRAILEEKSHFTPGTVEEGPILAGSRYDTLFRAGRKMQFQGIPEEGIFAALLAMNRERCQPPHTEKHVRKIVQGIMSAEPPINPETGATSPERELIRVRRTGTQDPLNWSEVWTREYPPITWVENMEGLVIAERATNLYGTAGTGKSELALHRAVEAARAGVRVLWLDREMTEVDVKERLNDMGFNPDDLDNLIYMLYPELPLLDSEDGGRALVEMANVHDADVIVLDSLSKFLGGDEQDSGTHTKFWVWTLIPLRQARRAILLIDHAGKDISRGARGTSAKMDNVDLYMEITRNQNGAYLTTKKQRHSWVRGMYSYRRYREPHISYDLSNYCTICGRPAVGVNESNRLACEFHTRTLTIEEGDDIMSLDEYLSERKEEANVENA